MEKFTSEDIRQFFLNNNKHPIHKRIDEIVEMLENLTSSHMKYTLDDEDVFMNGLTCKDGWIYARISADYDDGDIGGTVHFSFPARLLSLDNVEVKTWINQYKTYLDKRDDCIGKQEHVDYLKSHIDELNQGVKNLQDPLWIQSQIEKLENEINETNNEFNNNVEELEALQDKKQQASSFENELEQHCEKDGYVRFGGRDMKLKSHLPWRDICSS
jgi:hypothetical protein